ncbi:MAG: fibronectin type III domain-containing protein, partial [Clostridia bacterium]|nr:fibronectin type III domain-containing protein [Clostridia bacterium]
GWDAYVTCSRCDYTTYNEIPALGHDEIPHDAKAPDCDEIGWDAYVTCSRCDYTTYNEIPALGHDEIPHDAKAPDCNEIGWDAYVTCSRCDYTTYNELTSLGHDFSKMIIDEAHFAAARTCAAYAQYYYECSRCGVMGTDTFGNEAEGLEPHVRVQTVSDRYIAVPAGCETPASYYMACENCDTVLDDETYEYGGPKYHLFMVEKVSVRAGLRKEGAVNFYCADCDTPDPVPIPFAGIETVELEAEVFSYNGKEITPEVTVRDSDGAALVKDTDFTVSYSDNKAPGRATAEVTFIGKYEGSKTLEFTITELPATSNIDFSSTSASVKLTWKAVPFADGYKIFDGEGNEIGSTNEASFTVGNLKAATDYAFSVKAYAAVDGETYVSGSSKSISAATKPAKTATVTATSTVSSVTVRWSKVTGADSYDIYKYNSRTKAYEFFKNVKGTSLTEKSLKSLTSYYYSVRAVKNAADGTKLTGDPKNIKVTTIPTAVSSLTASTTASSVTLKWSKVSGVESYNVYKYNTDKKDYEFYKTVTGTSVTVKSLRSAATYQYAVRAVKAVDGEELISASKSVKATTKPSAVSSLTASTTASSVTLKWNKVSGAESYNVYKYNTSKKAYEFYKSVTGASITVSSLKSVTTYQYAVRAFETVDGKKLLSDSKSVKVTTKPSAVSGLTASTTASSVTLKWSKVSGADGYNVYKYNTSKKAYEFYKSVTGTSITVKSLKSVATYQYAVRAVKTVGGEKLLSSSKSLKATTLPLATSKLTATASTTAVTLKWSKVTGADSYNVYKYNASKKAYELYKTVTGTSLTVKSLNSAATYHFAVRAVKTVDGKKLLSSSKTVKIVTKPSAVTGLAASVTASSVTLKWNKTTGADSYNVYKYNSKTKAYELYKTVTGTSITVNGLNSATTYAYAVRAVKAKIMGASKSISVTTRPVAVSGLTASADSSSVTLKWSKVTGADSYNVYIYDATRKAYTFYRTVTATSITVNNLRSATGYIFCVRSVKITADQVNTLGDARAVSIKTTAAAPSKIAVSTSGTAATVKWNKAAGAQGYQVAYKDGKTGEIKLMGNVNASTFTLTKGGFTEGVKYLFGVRSYNIVNGKPVYSAWRSQTVTMK